jgi:peptide/nickel transport system ATP-binding protein
MNTHRDEKPILSIRDLHVSFRMRNGVVRALHGLDLDLAPRETLGLVGESGCGKSVTAQAILRVVPHPGEIHRGEIILRPGSQTLPAEVDIAALPAGSRELNEVRRRHISMIFQEPMTSLSPVHTIGDQIIEACRLGSQVTHEEARDRSIELLRRVGIPKPEQRIDRYTFELSGGMRQRAMIAMALASEPSLLIADEPTTAIDVTIQAQILDLLRELQQDTGLSLIIITHDLGVVASIADRVAVMYRGVVIEYAGCEELFEDPKHPYTRGLLSSVPDLTTPGKSRIETIRGTVPNPFASIPGCEFHPRCDHFMKGICDARFPEETVVNGEQGTTAHTTRCYLYSIDRPQEKAQ